MLERALCPTLVGRDEQLFALEDALLAAHRGESGFIALGGEAGMGKTRLARELAARARRLDWEVLWGACSEAELPLPYLPLGDAGAARPPRPPPDGHAVARARHVPKRRARPSASPGAAPADVASFRRGGNGCAVAARARADRGDDRGHPRRRDGRAGIPRPDAPADGG